MHALSHIQLSIKSAFDEFTHCIHELITAPHSDHKHRVKSLQEYSNSNRVLSAHTNLVSGVCGLTDDDAQ